jgi:hypothetical protein
MNIQTLAGVAVPERHADRIIAEMLRGFAKARSHLWEDVCRIIGQSSDGTPRAQEKMKARILKAGALAVDLKAATRGRYEMLIYDWTGWDPGTEEGEIKQGDAIPEKPWIACWATLIRGREFRRSPKGFKSGPILIINHHALSRAAQRHNVRTVADMLSMCSEIWSATCKLLNEKGVEPALNAPAAGWRAPLESGGFVVLARYRNNRRALIAITVMKGDEPDRDT